MGYISLSWYDIPELVVPIRISLIDRELLLTRKRLNQGFLLVKFKSSLRKLWLAWPLWNIFVTNDHSNVPLFVNTSRSFSQSLVIIGFVTRLTQPVHLSSLPDFGGVRVTRSLVLYVYFEDRCLSFCTFSIGYCVVCSSLINGFWLPLWYLQYFSYIVAWNTLSDRTVYMKSLKIPKGQSESVNRRSTDNTMTKIKSTKGQTTIYKTYTWN
jgi:hypothetical protein